ncbi:MAG: transposase [Thermodesulfovibrionia bacterium]|nr:transposase [Thermodesulfovibrionia bacterium]
MEEPLTEKLEQLVKILELVRIEDFIRIPSYWHGQSPKDRKQIARAFVAKAVYNMSSTRELIDRLKTTPALRRICGWERASQIPHESSFSRAFAEFAQNGIALIVHESLINQHLKDSLVGHISRDSTAIEAREKPQKKDKVACGSKSQKPKRKQGRPKKGEERVKEPTRLERQQSMSIEEALKELPKGCDVGTKKNSKGYKESWIGYKLHIDAADGHIPVSCILTSASVHDSQAAIPLAQITNQRVTNLYDLMDSAYDAPIIREHSKSLGHVPIIDINPRGNKKLKEELKAEEQRLDIINFKRPEDRRYNERSNVERVNGRLKDEFGGKMVRVRGCAKVMAHLMFGILALTADQLFRLII